jgi:histidine ammonia-lyase
VGAGVADPKGPLTLTGQDLTIDDVVEVSRFGRQVRLDDRSMERLAAAHDVARRAVQSDQVVYGLTTGVGALKKVAAHTGDDNARARNLLQAHITPLGEPLADEIVRAAMLHRANALAKGRTVVRSEVPQAYVRALNDGYTPEVASLAWVGPSDLSPMAQIALSLMDKGLTLEAGEALATMNANSLSVGHGALALHDAGRLLGSLDVTAALSLEAFGGNISILHTDVATARPYPGLKHKLERLRYLLEGSYLWQPEAPRNLQDPLSFRCIPNVHGAAWEALEYARRQVETELNASGDNPMVVPAEDLIISTGNFDITSFAMAFDLVRIAIAHVLTLSCERVEKHLSAHSSGLPTGLRIDDSQEDEALSMIDQASMSLTGEARLMATPVSLETSTSSSAEGIEDRSIMTHLGVRRLAEMTWLGARLCGVEMVVASQAVDLRGNPRLGRSTRLAYQTARDHVPFAGSSVVLADALEALGQTVERTGPDFGHSDRG